MGSKHCQAVTATHKEGAGVDSDFRFNLKPISARLGLKWKGIALAVTGVRVRVSVAVSFERDSAIYDTMINQLVGPVTFF
jgi:hypothetical protein